MIACRADAIAARAVEGKDTGTAQVEAARSDAPDAFQGLRGAQGGVSPRRLSVDRRCGNQRRVDGVRAEIDHTGGRGQLRRGLAVLRRRAGSRRLRGRRGAVPRRGARRRVRGVPALPRIARGHGAARRPRRLRRLLRFRRHRPRGRGRAAAPRGGPVDGQRRGGDAQTAPHVRDGVAARRRVARVEASTASPPGPRRCSACRIVLRVAAARAVRAHPRSTSRTLIDGGTGQVRGGQRAQCSSTSTMLMKAARRASASTWVAPAGGSRRLGERAPDGVQDVRARHGRARPRPRSR